MKPAVKFRNKIYAGDPRHKDAIDKAMEKLTRQQQIRAYHRISDGKEEILFGWIDDQNEFMPEPEFQKARLIMYGFD